MAPTVPRDQRVQQANFTKTKMCKFNLLGACAKGPACPYAHSAEELQTPPDLRRTRLCKTLLKTGTCTLPGCTYAHNAEELREVEQSSTPVVVDTTVIMPPKKDEQQLTRLENKLRADNARLRDERMLLERMLQDLQVAGGSIPPPPGLCDGLGREPAVTTPAYIPVPHLDRLGGVGGELGRSNGCEAMPSPFRSYGMSGYDSSNIVVDQTDGIVKIVTGASLLPAGLPAKVALNVKKPLRSVRTSESTLCSLSETVC